jgi:RNA polymerase sigma factor (sigma-70 family)
VEASALSAPAGLHRGSVGGSLLRLRSDEQLVALFRAGNEEAFDVIHDRYRQRLFGYARQMLGGSRSDAEDVLQDVFLRAYRALRADGRPVSLRAWLYRVAHNRCVDHLRRPVPAVADVFEMSRAPLRDPLVEAEQREDLRRLVVDVRRLPSQQRSALLMREMNGMTYTELADALETTVPAVKSLLVRARIGLVEAIEARDADCADIRHDLAASYDRGVRTSGHARRHLRDCTGCTRYRAQLREVRRGFAALSPSPAPAGVLAKLLGLGGASSGAAAAGGGSVAVGGGAAAAVSATKVAALVCCAAALTGGAAVVRVHEAGAPPAPRAVRAHPGAAAGAAPRQATVRASAAAAALPARGRAGREGGPGAAVRPAAGVDPTSSSGDGQSDGNGGAMAPDETPSAGDRATDGPTAEPPLAGVLPPGTEPATGSGPAEPAASGSPPSATAASNTEPAPGSAPPPGGTATSGSSSSSSGSSGGGAGAGVASRP